MTFGGRQPLVEDNLQWQTTFGGRQPLVEDDLLWKTIFSERQPSVEGDLWWKMTFHGRRPLLDPYMLPRPLCGVFFLLETSLLGLLLSSCCSSSDELWDTCSVYQRHYHLILHVSPKGNKYWIEVSQLHLVKIKGPSHGYL